MIITQKLAIYYDDNTLLYLRLRESMSESTPLFPTAATIRGIPFDNSAPATDGAWFT